MRNTYRIVCAAWLIAMTGCTEIVETEPIAEGIDRQEHGLDHFKSLAIVDEHILRPFTFRRVLDQLVAQSGIPGMTSLQLFNQWWDTQNLPPSPLAAGMGLHCEDGNGFQGINGFPWECPRLEGHQAGIPFELPNDPLYIPIGLFNRFDLAPASGAHCGEYRIVFAMRPGHPLQRGKRNFVIFEAILPNPNPGSGLAGCRPVAQFWEHLSNVSDAQRRADLEKFYFHGLGGGFEPVVHVDHYGARLGANGYACSTGQIRTNEFEQGPWTMREFKLVRDCRCAERKEDCRLVVKPMTVKTNPYGEMFTDGFGDPRTLPLQSSVAAQIGSLSLNDVNRFGYEVDDQFNAAESPIDDGAQVNNYPQRFINTPLTSGTFAHSLQSLLGPGASLTPEDIVARAHALSCAGCHRQSNSADLGDGLIWPDSLGFTHIDEVAVGFPPRFPVSPAVEKEFLPFREKLLIEFLKNGAPPGSAEKCELGMPETLQMSPEECREREEREREASERGEERIAVEVKIDSAAIREMRARWEGERGILGRKGGH